jgi:hypothetical protein
MGGSRSRFVVHRCVADRRSPVSGARRAGAAGGSADRGLARPASGQGPPRGGDASGGGRDRRSEPAPRTRGAHQRDGARGPAAATGQGAGRASGGPSGRRRRAAATAGWATAWRPGRPGPGVVGPTRRGCAVARPGGRRPQLGVSARVVVDGSDARDDGFAYLADFGAVCVLILGAVSWPMARHLGQRRAVLRGAGLVTVGALLLIAVSQLPTFRT